MSSGENERERLSHVYSRYRDDKTQSRWAAENPGNRRIIEERFRVVSQLIARHGLAGEPTVIDIGCGGSAYLPPELTAGRLVGLDILFERLPAPDQDHDGFVVNADAQRLPFPDGLADVVTMFTVLSSILDDQVQQAIAGDIDRVLRPGGCVLLYDFRYRNPMNPNTRPVRRTHLEQLFPRYRLDMQTLTVIPQVARRLGPLTDVAYPTMARLPVLRSHVAAVLTKPGAPA